jgi:anti-sigma factor ChrR (cupin superfamily)
VSAGVAAHAAAPAALRDLRAELEAVSQGLLRVNDPESATEGAVKRGDVADLVWRAQHLMDGIERAIATTEARSAPVRLLLAEAVREVIAQARRPVGDP